MNIYAVPTTLLGTAESMVTTQSQPVPQGSWCASQASVAVAVLWGWTKKGLPAPGTPGWGKS